MPPPAGRHVPIDVAVATEHCVGALGFCKDVVPNGTGNDRNISLNEMAVGLG